METIINVPINANGVPKPSSKTLCNQYETGVSKFNITLDSSWINSSYFYYLVVMPPEESKVTQYAVPIIPVSNVLTFDLTSGITWHLGGYKFAVVAMSQVMPDTGVIPTNGVVSISDVWEGEVNAIPFNISGLAAQPVDPAFTLLYDNLMALKIVVESNSAYAKLQGDYAKGEGDKVATALVTVTAQGNTSKEQGNTAETKGLAAETKGLAAQAIADALTLALAEGDFDGADGTNGISIVSILKTDTVGLVDTYTITKSDETTSTFTVTNGEDGDNGITPHIDPTTKHWFIGETDTGIVAEGADGTGSGDMLASEYDPNSDGIVKDSDKLGGQLPSHYATSDHNHTGTYQPVMGEDDNYMTDDEKTKLTGIAAGAEVNVNADWNAVSGDAQILNKPTIPSAVTVTNNLTTSTTGTALDAAQGKVLADLIGDVETLLGGI